jgi:hypothetical protein
MAWSDAARRASALVRRRMGEAKGRFHEYGTPKFDPHYTTPAYRTKMAGRLKDLRKRTQAGYTYSMSEPDRQIINDAAYASRMRTHWAAPKRTQGLGAAKAGAKSYGASQSKPLLQQYKEGSSRKKLRAAISSSPGRVTSGRKRSRGRY